jgi:hypothetical protein
MMFTQKETIISKREYARHSHGPHLGYGHTYCPGGSIELAHGQHVAGFLTEFARRRQ